MPDEASTGNFLSTPFKCPLTKCEENISPSLLLSHFMKVHQRDDNSVDLKEVQENEKISLIVSVTDNFLELNKNICLGVLAYETDSAAHSNVLLAKQHEPFEQHLPVLIMACRGNYVDLLDNEADFIDPDANFFAIWLLMPEVGNKKLHTTLSVHNEQLTKSISTLIQVRGSNETQDIRQFMEDKTDFLIINSGFLKDISNNGNVFVEIALAENSL